MQIGLLNLFDPAFWQAYGSESITGIEISQYKNKEELSALLAFCQSKGLMFGIHAPIFSNRLYPKVISPERAEWEAGMEQIREEARLAADFGADYLLYHYPYPPILASEHDSNFRGKPEFDHNESAKIDPDQLRETSIRLFEKLCSIQKEYNQRIVLEYDFFGDSGELFVEMFRSYPEIGLVVDVRRTEVHRRAFPKFDLYKWLDEVAPFVYLVHYSNTHFADGKWTRHLPVLPNQIDDPEYGDAYQYLQFLAERNDRFHVTFEHNPTRATRQQLDSCYDLVKHLIMDKEKIHSYKQQAGICT